MHRHVHKIGVSFSMLQCLYAMESCLKIHLLGLKKVILRFLNFSKADYYLFKQFCSKFLPYGIKK